MTAVVSTPNSTMTAVVSTPNPTTTAAVSTTNPTGKTLEVSTTNATGMSSATTAANATTVATHLGTRSTQVTPVSPPNTTVPIQPTTALTPLGHRLDTGLVILIVILVLILIVGVLITAVKYSQQGKPEFKRLQEMPMDSVNEDVPFAKYPPK
ncbi:uncharacterized protein LOC144607443 [Rhinoraja longicauda]